MRVNRKIVSVIFARSGSSLKNKNLRLLDGKPLLFYSIYPALQIKNIDEVIVATDGNDIANYSKECGANIVMLPPELCSNEKGTNSSLLYFCENYSNLNDVLIYMQPTDLFKNSVWIDECIDILCGTNYTSVFIGSPTHKNYWVQNGDMYNRIVKYDDPHANRQVKMPIFREDTGIGCAINVKDILRTKTRLGDNPRLIPKEYMFFDLHDELDFYMAEKFLKYENNYSTNSK